MTIRRRGSESAHVQKWLLNLVIFCLSVVIIGFIFSMVSRYTSNRTKVDLATTGKFELTPEDLLLEKPFLNIKVEVLNGCGVNGLAHKFSNYLRKEGFDVLYVGNADRLNYTKTLILNRSSDIKKCNEVIKALKLDKTRMVNRPRSGYRVDVSIILGKDYKDLAVYKDVLSISEEF